MADLIVVTPSRGRPDEFHQLVNNVRYTTDGRAEVVGLLDDDDPRLPGYLAEPYYPCRMWTGPRRSLASWTNHAAARLLDAPDPPRYLASLGDDHRPRTPGWDRKLIEAIEQLDGPGFAYGNDLLQGANLPTAWVASAEAVRALGWMMLPGCQHMYVDTAILAIGKAAGRIAYRPDVVVEHVHPLAGKASWDQSYRESNTEQRYAADRAAFEQWQAECLAADVATLKSLS